MDNLQILKQLSLSDKEIKVFTTLISSGPSAVTGIARQAGIKRPSTYFVLSKLVEKGLVSRSQKDKKELFQAEDPRILLSLVKSQTEKMNDLEKAVKKLIPNLNNLALTNLKNPRIRIIEGKEGVWSLAEDTLRKKQSIYALGSEEKLYQIYSHRLHQYELRRQMRLINLYVLTEEYPSKLKNYLQSLQQKFAYIEYRFLPPNVKINVYFLIYGDKVALVSLTDPITGVIIEDQAITSILKLMFDALWQIASPN